MVRRPLKTDGYEVGQLGSENWEADDVPRHPECGRSRIAAERRLLAEACPSTQNDVTDCLLSELTISARTKRISCSTDCKACRSCPSPELLYNFSW
jgi:hypothetical protein